MPDSDDEAYIIDIGEATGALNRANGVLDYVDDKILDGVVSVRVANRLPIDLSPDQRISPKGLRGPNQLVYENNVSTKREVVVAPLLSGADWQGLFNNVQLAYMRGPEYTEKFGQMHVTISDDAIRLMDETMAASAVSIGVVADNFRLIDDEDFYEEMGPLPPLRYVAQNMPLDYEPRPQPRRGVDDVLPSIHTYLMQQLSRLVDDDPDTNPIHSEGAIRIGAEDLIWFSEGVDKMRSSRRLGAVYNSNTNTICIEVIDPRGDVGAQVDEIKKRFGRPVAIQRGVRDPFVSRQG